MKDEKRIKTWLDASLKGLIALLSVTLILNAAPAAADGDNAKNTKDTGLRNVPVEKLTAEFDKIRKIKGHFDGGKWNPEVDQWRGRKHRLMIELGVRLSNGKYHKSDIGKLLGQPDQIVKKGHDLFDLITSQPGYDSLTAGVYEFHVYYWRGTHDFLFFTCQDNVIVNSGWWYAGE
jgi:hypothetical protein